MGLFGGSRSEKQVSHRKKPTPNIPLLFSSYTPLSVPASRVTATPESILILIKLVEVGGVEPPSEDVRVGFLRA